VPKGGNYKKQNPQHKKKIEGKEKRRKINTNKKKYKGKKKSPPDKKRKEKLKQGGKAIRGEVKDTWTKGVRRQNGHGEREARRRRIVIWGARKKKKEG